MAYQLTNATNIEDLIDKIADFAVTAGWTERRNDLSGSSRTLTLQKSGDNIHIYNSDTTYLRVNASVGYDDALAGNAQPNQAVSNVASNVGTGPFPNVFLFSDNSPAEYIHAVIEIASGIFRMVSFGELVKTGAYTGGTYFEASGFDATSSENNMASSEHHRMFDNGTGFSNPFGGGGVRCDVDGETNYFAPFRRLADFATPCASGGFWGELSTGADRGYRTREFYYKSINTVFGITPLAPVLIRVERDDGYWSDIGEVPGLRFMNMSRFAPGDEFTIGSDTWKVFPWLRKGNVEGQPYSQDLAFAFLKS